MRDRTKEDEKWVLLVVSLVMLGVILLALFGVGTPDYKGGCETYEIDPRGNMCH